MVILKKVSLGGVFYPMTTCYLLALDPSSTAREPCGAETSRTVLRTTLGLRQIPLKKCVHYPFKYRLWWNVSSKPLDGVGLCAITFLTVVTPPHFLLEPLPHSLSLRALCEAQRVQ